MTPHLKFSFQTTAESHGRQRVAVPKVERLSALPRVPHITNLAPDIQLAILDLELITDHVPRFREREVRAIAITANWEKQRQMWKHLVKRTQKSRVSE